MVIDSNLLTPNNVDLLKETFDLREDLHELDSQFKLREKSATAIKELHSKFENIEYINKNAFIKNITKLAILYKDSLATNSN
jgi:hypothetical protein